jgi:hypothetical protein
MCQTALRCGLWCFRFVILNCVFVSVDWIKIGVSMTILLPLCWQSKERKMVGWMRTSFSLISPFGKCYSPQPSGSSRLPPARPHKTVQTVTNPETKYVPFCPKLPSHGIRHQSVYDWHNMHRDRTIMNVVTQFRKAAIQMPKALLESPWFVLSIHTIHEKVIFDILISYLPWSGFVTVQTALHHWQATSRTWRTHRSCNVRISLPFFCQFACEWDIQFPFLVGISLFSDDDSIVIRST